MQPVNNAHSAPACRPAWRVEASGCPSYRSCTWHPAGVTSGACLAPNPAYHPCMPGHRLQVRERCEFGPHIFCCLFAPDRPCLLLHSDEIFIGPHRSIDLLGLAPTFPPENFEDFRGGGWVLWGGTNLPRGGHYMVAATHSLL